MDQYPVRIYINRALMPSDVSHSPLLYPHLGLVRKDSNPMVTFALEKYGYTSEGFELVATPEEADYVMVPNAYWHLKRKYPERLRQMLDEAVRHQKPVLIDGSGDQEFPIRVPNSVVLRIGMWRFKALPNELAIPVIAEDLLETEVKGPLPVRTKNNRPVLAFSGWARLPLKQYVRASIKAFPYRFLSLFDSRYGTYVKGVLLRIEVIRSLANAKRITTNFILRRSYSANKKTVEGNITDVRKEFVENLLASDYALSVRGDANADTRFYEAISLGRIPVFVDSERVMPFEDMIDYSAFSVHVPFDQRRSIDKILGDFHNSLTPEKFEAMQRQARLVFERYLRNDVATKYIAGELRRRLERTTKTT